MRNLLIALFFCLSSFGDVLTNLVQVNVGTSANDRTGDTLRLSMMKLNSNTITISNIVGGLSTSVSNLEDEVSIIGSSSATNKLTINSNLLDVASIVAARTNLGVIATSSNLLDVASITGARTNLGDSFPTSNTDIVQAGPYDSATSGSVNFGPSSGQTSIEWIDRGWTYRIRQTGNVAKVKLYVGPKTGLTHFYVKIWRLVGSTWDLIATSEDILSSLTASTVNTVTLGTALAVQEGDFIGGRAEYTSASAQNFFAKTSTVTTNFSVLNTTPSTTAYNWDAQTATPAVSTPIEILMSAPKFVTIGDSIMSGRPGTASFVDGLITPLSSSQAVLIPGTIAYQIGQATGYAYQNMGMGSDILTGISGRFTSDVLLSRPKFVVMEGGVNDLLGGTTTNSMITSWTTMLNLCVSSNVTPVVVGILPFRGYSLATDAMLRTRDLVNGMLQSLALSHSGFYVNPDPYVGRFYAAGDAGNTWQLQSVCDSGDGIHPSPQGYARVGQAVLDVIAPAPTKGGTTLGTLNLQGNMRLEGSGTRTIEITPNTRYKTAGNNLVLRAGAASPGQTDLSGGDIVLESGISSGTGTSKVSFNVPPLGTTGTTANAPAESFRVERFISVGATASRLISASQDAVYRAYDGTTYKGGIGYDSGLNSFGIYNSANAATPTFYVDSSGNYTCAPTTSFTISGAGTSMRVDGGAAGISPYWTYNAGTFKGGFGFNGGNEVGIYTSDTAGSAKFAIDNSDQSAIFRNTNTITMSGGTSVKLKVVGGQDTVNQNSANAYFGSTATKLVWIGYSTTSDVGYVGAVNNGVAVEPLVLNPNGGTLGLGVATGTPSDWIHFKTNGAAQMRLEFGASTAGGIRFYGTSTYKGGVGWDGGNEVGLYDSHSASSAMLYIDGSTVSGGFRGTGAFTIGTGGLAVKGAETADNLTVTNGITALDVTASTIAKFNSSKKLISATLGTDVLDSTYISDTAYDATSWNGVTTIAPSKNAVRDQMVLMATLADPIFTGSLQLPNGAAPTTDAFGEIAGDNNAWGTGRGTVQIFDGTANTYAVNVLASDTPTNGQVPKWNTGGTITWEDDATGAGGGDAVSVNTSAVTDADLTDTLSIAWTATGSSPATVKAAFAQTATLAGNPALAANGVAFGTTGLIFEGATADTIEGLLTVADVATSDKTWTLPDRSGTVALSGDTFTGDVTGTLNSSGATALTIAADAVALGTDTTGNYLASASNGAGITGASASAEGGTIAPAWDPVSFVNNITMWDASQATRTWTANLSGATDPVITFGNSSVDITTGTLKQGGTAVALQSTTITVAGTALDIVSSAGAQDLSANRTWTLSLDRTATLAGNPTLAASAAAFATTGIIFEGATADTIEGLLAAADQTGADHTWTLPNADTFIPISSQVLTFAGPTAARTITFPDAAITVARTDAANTFTGHQTIEGVTSTGATGTGKFVFDGSPTIVTPTIADLSNMTHSHLNNAGGGVLSASAITSGTLSAARLPAVIIGGVATLTDAATVATDASLGNVFRVTLGGNRTLGNPTNPTDGQRATWELIQDGTGSRTITLDTKFALGTDITSVTLTTTASKRDFLTAIYNSTPDKWYVVGFIKGF